MICHGARVGYFQGDLLKIIEDVQKLQPTLFVAVPRIMNKLYDLISQGFGSLTGYRKRLVDMAVDTKLSNLRKSGAVTHFIYDKLVFNKCKNILGGKVRSLFTGGAPIADRVFSFIKICF